jgi:hypothetical protein
MNDFWFDFSESALRKSSQFCQTLTEIFDK